ncbi:unnamed protein product, partial [marine sediment metagenome]
LDLTLTSMEQELAKLELANAASTGQLGGTLTQAKLRTGSIPPAPAGLTLLVNIPGSIVVEWSRIPQVDIQYYEVQITHTDTDFDGQDTRLFTIGGATTYNFTEGDPDLTYFIRVRGASTGGPGIWSGVLNSDTGIATSNVLSLNSTSNLSVTLQTVFNPSIVSSVNPTGEYLFTEFNVREGTIFVLGIVIGQTLLNPGSPGDSFFSRLKEDGIVIFESVTENSSATNCSVYGMISQIAIPQNANIGPRIYSIELEAV